MVWQVIYMRWLLLYYCTCAWKSMIALAEWWTYNMIISTVALNCYWTSWPVLSFIMMWVRTVMMLVWFKHLCIAALNKYTQSTYQSCILSFIWFKVYTNVWLMHYNEYLFVLVLLCLWRELGLIIILLMYWHLLLVHTTPMQISDLLLAITTKCTFLH